jgi:hypothetical protein
MHHHGNIPHGHDHGHTAHGHHDRHHHGHQPGGSYPEQGLSSPVREDLERSDPGQPQYSPKGEGCPKRGGTASCSRECRTCQYGGGTS